MKKIISLCFFSIALLSSAMRADEFSVVYNKLAHDDQSASTAGTKIEMALVPALAFEWATNNNNCERTKWALSLLLADIFGQAAHNELKKQNRNDCVADVVEKLTNRCNIALATAAAIVVLNKFKPEWCTMENATKITVLPYAVAILIQQIDSYLNEEAYKEKNKPKPSDKLKPTEKTSTPDKSKTAEKTAPKAKK